MHSGRMQRLPQGISTLTTIRPTRWVSGCVVLGVLSGLAGPASAQATATDRFTGQVGVETTYSSNVAGGGDQVAALRGLQKGDVTYSPTISGVFRLPFGGQSLSVSGSAGLQRHVRNKDLDSENFQISAGGGVPVGPCGLGATASFAHSQTAPVDLVIAVRKNINESTALGANVSCGVGALVGAVGATYSRSGNNAAGFLDSDSKAATVSLGYANEALGSLSLTAQYSESGYGSTPAIGLASPSNFREYGGGLNYSRRLGLRLSGTAGISFVQIDSANNANSSVNANVGLNYRLSQRATLGLNYSHVTQPSRVVGAAFARSQSAQLNGAYQFSTRLSGSLSLSATRDLSRGGVQIPLVVRDNKSFSVNGGVGYRLGRDIDVHLNGTYTERTADLGLYNFSSESVSLSVARAF